MDSVAPRRYLRFFWPEGRSTGRQAQQMSTSRSLLALGVPANWPKPYGQIQEFTRVGF